MRCDVSREMQIWIVRAILALAALLWPASISTGTADADVSRDMSNTWIKVKEDGRRALVIAKIKAAFADHKQIQGRYIRVRFDGKVLQLAGFVPTQEIADIAATTAKDIARLERVETFWSIDKRIKNRPVYKTYISEQARDELIKTKILAALVAPGVRAQLQRTEIIHIDVEHGDVTIYIVADGPPLVFNFDSHITSIEGVGHVEYQILKGF